MTPKQTFEDIRVRYHASRGLRRLAEKYEAEWREQVREAGYAPSVVARETGIELKDIEEGL